jgi:hypothetical protein
MVYKIALNIIMVQNKNDNVSWLWFMTASRTVFILFWKWVILVKLCHLKYTDYKDFVLSKQILKWFTKI